MASHGGARNRSGPPPQPGSATSERRGLTFQSLPASGYDGDIPAWPLARHASQLSPEAEAWLVDAVKARDSREEDLWHWAWRTPQACAWAQPSEAWRIQSVARWVRQAVLCESSAAKAADHAQLHRYADQIGLTTAGLREMGWKVATDEIGAKRAERDTTNIEVARPRRLRG